MKYFKDCTVHTVLPTVHKLLTGICLCNVHQNFILPTAIFYLIYQIFPQYLVNVPNAIYPTCQLLIADHMMSNNVI